MRLPRIIAWAAMAAGIALLPGLASCDPTPPEVLSRKEMARLLADVHQADAVIEQNYTAYSSDSARLALRRAVYDRHGVTAATVDTSLAWYGRHMDLYLQVYDETLEILDRRLASVKSDGADAAEQSAIAADGDSVVVWRSWRPSIFSPRMERAYLTASISRDRYWEKGDIYELRYKTLRQPQALAATLTAAYDGNTYESVSRESSRGSGWMTLRLPTDTARRTQTLMLVIRCEAAHGEPFAVVDSLSIMRIRKK